VYIIDDLDKRGLNCKITKLKGLKRKLKGLECNFGHLGLRKKTKDKIGIKNGNLTKRKVKRLKLTKRTKMNQ
jgi:hypothetical protein